jgi:perosamine synthetase
MNNKIIPISKPHVDKSDSTYVLDAVDSGWVSSLGPYIQQFEHDFSQKIAVRHCLSVGNGTVGLHLALAALGIGVGDEVIVPDITFIATANAVQYTGATPIFCDIKSSDLNMCADSFRDKISDKTRAVILVHLYGRVADVGLISEIAKEKNIYLIEDCAEALGGEYNGKPVGSFGDVSVFSFYGNKSITTGEGGMVCTQSEDLYKKAVKLRDHGMSTDKRYWHDEVGYNYRMTNMQAALGCSQLQKLSMILRDRKRIYDLYKELLENNSDIQVLEASPNTEHAMWLFDIRIKSLANECDREQLSTTLLKDFGIDTRPTFYPLTMMPMYLLEAGFCELSRSTYHQGLCLPTYFGISDEDIRYIVSSLTEVLKG